MSNDGGRDRTAELRRGDGTGFLTGGRIVALVAVALVVLFAVQNSASGEIAFLWFSFELPIWVYFVIMFVLGWITGKYARRRKT
jgi:uncharacterized integral membrane protein